MRRDDLNHAVYLQTNKLQIESSSQIKNNRKLEINRVLPTDSLSNFRLCCILQISRDLCTIVLIPRLLKAARVREGISNAREPIARSENLRAEGGCCPNVSPCVLLGNLEILESKRPPQ